MATEIYLGNPPQHVIDWIKAHSKPTGNPKTKITFADGSVEEYDWSGEIDSYTMMDAGLYDGSSWRVNPQTVEIGTKVTSIGNGAFTYCASLTNVTIPDSVTSIGDYAFSECRGLTNVTIGNGMTSIGESAFYNCEGLTSITIPDSVTSIRMDAFSGCLYLTSVTFSGKDKATVQSMSGYSWYFMPGSVIHCTDGDITLELN